MVGIFVLTDIYKQIIAMTYIIPENIQKLILEFEQKEINKIFQLGNTVTFFVKSGGATHPINLKIIQAPIDMGDHPLANVFFAQNLSPYPIDVKGKYFMITNPNQDIRSGSFDVLIIGKQGKDGVIPTTRTRYTFKDIFKVDARDKTNKLIDSYYSNDHESKDDTNTDKTQSRQVNGFIQFIDELKQGDSMVLTLTDNSTIKLDFIDIKGDAVQFEISKNSKLSDNYKTLATASSIELSKNIDDISVDEKNETISVKARAFHNVDDKMVPTDSAISNITDWEIVEKGDEAEEDDIDDDNEDSSEEAKKMMQAILNDPLMKKAFYRQPTLWNLILSTIKGKNPRGTGIGPAKNIISQCGEMKQIERIGPQGENFKREKWARFKVLYREIIINPTGLPDDELKLTPNEEYHALVLKNELGNDDPLTLTNKKLKYKVQILKPYKDVPDAFEVSVIKTIESKSTGIVKDYKKFGVLQFVSENGSGYSKKETKKEPTPVAPEAPVNTK